MKNNYKFQKIFLKNLVFQLKVTIILVEVLFWDF